MAVRALGSTGRPPKGGVKKHVVQARIPVPMHSALVDVATASEMPLTDLGAYYLIEGWNVDRARKGMAPIPMPAYLEEAKQAADRVEDQDLLEEELLEVS